MQLKEQDLHELSYNRNGEFEQLNFEGEFRFTTNEVDIMEVFVGIMKSNKWRVKDPPLLMGKAYYNARLLQLAYNRITKRASGANLTKITRNDRNDITLYYTTKLGKGNYKINALFEQ